MENKIITREKAIELITYLEDAGIFSDDVESGLADVRMCIEAEMRGYHFWGGDIDTGELYIARREDQWTEEVVDRTRKIAEKYSFSPAPHEKEELANYMKEIEE